MDARDTVNGKFGTVTAVTAVTASLGLTREWKMRSEMRSPMWTTNIAQVLVIRA